MKKISLTLSLQIITVLTFAQTINFGVKGGLTLSNQTISNTQSIAFDKKNLTGFHIGGFVNLGIQNFSIQSGIYYVTKGWVFPYTYQDGSGENPGKSENKYRLNYIEVPVKLLYKINVTSVSKIYFGGGPFLGYGISATASGKDLNTSKSISSKLTFGNGANQSDDYKNPDYGLNFVVGTEIEKKILVEAGYDLGLANISNSGGTNIKNRSINFSIGYMFL